MRWGWDEKGIRADDEIEVEGDEMLHSCSGDGCTVWGD